MDYSLKLNKELPADIRVLAWSTVPADFSARHASASWLYLQAVCRVNLLYRSQSCVTVAEILGAISKRICVELVPHALHVVVYLMLVGHLL